jgi:hypothetical protein
MVLNLLVAESRAVLVGQLQLYIAALAALLLLWRAPAGTLARRGALIAALGFAMMLGPQQIAYGHAVTLPFALLAATPAAFFRYPFRFSIVWGFGVTLLFAAVLDAAARLLGRAGTMIAVVVGLLTVGGLVQRVAGTGTNDFFPIREPVYAAVRDAIRADGSDGPLLELPYDRGRIHEGRGYVPSVEMQSMLGWTIHRQPLVVGYVDFPPPHRRWIDQAIARLPAGNAVDDLAGMTRLKWLLLHPREEWDRPAARDKLMHLTGLTSVLSTNGWDLLRVDRPIRHPEWYDGVLAGERRGLTILGTPIRKLEPAEAKALVWGGVPDRLEAGQFGVHKVSIVNQGTATWPSAARKGTNLVRYQVRWWRLGVPPTSKNAVRTRRYLLPHDLSPGEREDLLAWFAAPSTPGAYLVEVKIVQGNQSAFDGPENVAVRGIVTVTPRRPDRKPRPRAAVPAPAADEGELPSK